MFDWVYVRRGARHRVEARGDNLAVASCGRQDRSMLEAVEAGSRM
jgi:hypothetical protein